MDKYNWALPVVTFLPLAGALVMMLLPKEEEQLHKAIATEIVEQTTRLTGEEVRFLRKYLGLSGGDFSRRIDVTPTQLSRWERGHEKMSRMAERLLRLMVATELPVKNYSTELFDRIEEGRRSEKRVIKETPRGWSVAA